MFHPRICRKTFYRDLQKSILNIVVEKLNRDSKREWEQRRKRRKRRSLRSWMTCKSHDQGVVKPEITHADTDGAGARNA